MKVIGRPLLWLECRHHSGELMAKSTWNTLFEESMGPENEDYMSFSKVWIYLNKESIQQLNILPGFEESLKNNAVEILVSLLTTPNKNDQLPRDDYEEVAKLSLLALGHGDDIPGGFSWRKPGAVHKARFLANIIYGTKCFSFKIWM